METLIGNPLIKALIILFLLSATTATGNAHFIVSHKKHRSPDSNPAPNASPSLSTSTIKASPYDMSLVDDSWRQDVFDIVSGNTSKSWERLDAGGILSHSFELEAKRQGIFHGAPAVITFRVPTKASLQEAYSSPILPLDILAERPPEKKLEWRLLAKYGSQISVISIVVLFIYLIATPSKSSAAKASKKKR